MRARQLVRAALAMPLAAGLLLLGWPSRVLQVGPGCDNSCGGYAFDGTCDDGGVGARYSLCSFATDCKDCGERLQGRGDTEQCHNGCLHAGDNVCDDGGPGSAYAECALGSDCFDCGTANRYRPTSGCENSCTFAGDGVCDDGGPDSTFEECGLATDCGDCRPRSASSFATHGTGATSTAEREPHWCDDSCFYSNDMHCDDGGPAAHYHGVSRGI